jgi:GTP-binding protein
MPIVLEKTVYEPDDMQRVESGQIVLAGRSNVGKSSLINALAGRRNLARTSSTPGKTRSVNFYRVSEPEFYLVDLPGYGYAKRSKRERDKWARLVERYFRANDPVLGVVMVLDSRLQPQSRDLELLAYLGGTRRSIVPVLTKSDKCKMSQRTKVQRAWREILDPARPPLLCSAATGRSISELWRELLALAGGGEERPSEAASP